MRLPVRRRALMVTQAGPLQPLLDDAQVTDVLVNGAGPVWVDSGRGLRRVDVGLRDEAQVRSLAVRLALQGGRRLDDASPAVDARLPCGTRLHAVIPPVSAGGTLISLRVPRRRTFTLDELVACGTIPPQWSDLLTRIVRERLAFLVSGGTGTGKTTVLSTLLGLADRDERVLIVEDAAELRPSLPHVVRLEARHANSEGAGELTQADLVRHALRMRPDRVVVGECRGAEVRDLLSALNTGHEGGCGTVHANAPVDVPARLEALAALAGMTSRELAAQAASALDLVIHLRRHGGRRWISEIGWFCRDRAGELVVVPVVTAAGDRGEGWELLMERLGDGS